MLGLSGVAGLVYQVLWIKQLSLVVGVDVHAVTIGISAFFGGLALGGWAVGRLADRAASAWRLYLWLEVAIAVLGVAATLALARSAAPFAWLEVNVGAAAWALPLLLVALPAAAMGGTLPALMRAIAGDGKTGAAMGANGGRLYAANTAGAIAGTLLAAFVLIPLLGVTGSALAAAALNGLAALGAWWFGRGDFARAEAAPVLAASPASSRPGQRMLALALYALAGAIALGYEVVWSQAIVQFLSTRAFAFAVMLATYLAGLMIGSLLVARRVDRATDPWGAFALLVVGAGLVALVEFAWLGEWLPAAQHVVSQRVLGATGNLLAATCASFAVAALCIVFVPTLLLGAAFPYVVRLSVDPSRTGSGVGMVLALNTLGGIAGSVLAGVWLVPTLGVVHTLGVLATASGAVAILAIAFGDGVQRRARLVIPLLALVTLVVAVATPADRLAALLARTRGGELVFYEESRGATVAVVEQGKATQRFHRLYIQGVSNSGDTMTSLRYMRLQALLPLIVHNGTPRASLVIGLGTGITAGATLQYPGLERRVVAELLPAVVRAVPEFQGNFNVSRDPQVDIRLRDGRRELLQSTQRYDLITLEPLFLVMATQNPIEQEGTYPLPEAQMDRFLMHVSVGYPQADAEARIVRLARAEEDESGQAARTAGTEARLSPEAIFAARRAIHGVTVSEPVERYIVTLVQATRDAGRFDDDLKRWIQVGVSPRGSIGLDKVARAMAWLRGRDHVTPDDVQAVVHDVFRHRLILSYEAHAAAVAADAVIDRLLQRVAVA